jgi:hypothetical protein
MTNCPICNQPLNNEYECSYLWCDDCTKSWESFLEFGNTKFGDIAEWAANRARDFEKKKAEVLNPKTEDKLKSYLTLETDMLSLDESDPKLETIMDLMGELYYQLSDDDIKFLDSRNPLNKFLK